MIATGPYWWYVNIGTCSALSHCHEPVEGPVIWNVMTAMLRHCYNNATKRDLGITNDYISNDSVEVCFVISQDMLLNKQSSDWWLETSWRSCGVTVKTTPFQYYKWLRLQWESVGVSLVQVMACRLFGAKPIPEPVEGPVIWNVMTAKLRPCNNNAVITVITTRVVFIQIAKCADRRARTMGHAGSEYVFCLKCYHCCVYFSVLQLLQPVTPVNWPASGACGLP